MAAKVVELTFEIMDKWETLTCLKNKLTEGGFLNVTRCQSFGIRMNDIRAFVSQGLIIGVGENGKPKFRIREDVMVVEKAPFKGNDYHDELTYPGEESSNKSKATVKPENPVPDIDAFVEIYKTLAKQQRRILSECMKHTNWDYGQAYCKIKIAEVREANPDITNDDMSDVLVQFGYHVHSRHYPIPRFLREAHIDAEGNLVGIISVKEVAKNGQLTKRMQEVLVICLLNRRSLPDQRHILNPKAVYQAGVAWDELQKLAEHLGFEKAGSTYKIPLELIEGRY